MRLLQTHLRPGLSRPGQGLGPQLRCCLAVLCLGWDLLGLGLSGSLARCLPLPPWLQLPLAPSEELVHARGVNHVVGSPRCFVIVRNLKGNRQDENLTPLVAASEWAPGHLRTCRTPVAAVGVCRVSSELGAPGPWSWDTSNFPRAGSGAPKFGKMHRWWLRA